MAKAFLLALVLSVPAVASTEIVPGIHLIRGAFTPGSQPDGNSVIFVAPEGLIVVDTGRHASHTQAIVDFAKRSGKPVRAIVNTHWHLDHIGGNALLRREYPDVRVYASDALAAARTGFLASYRKQLEEMLAKKENEAFRAELALIDGAARLGPDEVIGASGAKTIAGRTLAIELEKDTVTAGDVWIRDGASGVVIAGDLVTLPAPFLDTADAKRWEAALERLAKTDFALLIPGHGPPLTRRQFAVYRTAFGKLIGCRDKCVDGWMESVGPLIPGEDPAFTRLLMEYYTGLLESRRTPGPAL